MGILRYADIAGLIMYLSMVTLVFSEGSTGNIQGSPTRLQLLTQIELRLAGLVHQTSSTIK